MNAGYRSLSTKADCFIYSNLFMNGATEFASVLNILTFMHKINTGHFQHGKKKQKKNRHRPPFL